MPQILGVVLIAIVLIYAFIYAMSMAIYALMLATPAAMVLAAVAFIFTGVFSNFSPGSESYHLIDRQSEPRLQRNSTKKVASTSIFSALMLGGAAGAAALYWGSQQLLQASGGDAQWVKTGGIIGAWGALFMFLIWLQSHLRNAALKTHSESIDALNVPLLNYLQSASSLNMLLKALHLNHEPNWAEILHVAETNSAAETTRLVSLEVAKKIDEAAAEEELLVDALREAIKVLQLAHTCSERAVAANNMAALLLISEIAEKATQESLTGLLQRSGVKALRNELLESGRKLKDLAAGIR